MSGESEMANQATHLNADTLATLRTRLETERARLRQMLAERAREAGSAAPEDTLLQDPSDFGEMASSITEEDTQLALWANDQRLLTQVERALERMDNGVYGLS